MYYEINVSLDGKHLFATAERSIRDAHSATVMLILFHEKFPESVGYKITCTRWDTVGAPVTLNSLYQEGMPT